jgi:hypothetical protein
MDGEIRRYVAIKFEQGNGLHEIERPQAPQAILLSLPPKGNTTFLAE